MRCASRFGTALRAKKREPLRTQTVPVLPVPCVPAPPPRPVSFYQNLIRDTPEPYRPHVTCVWPGSPAPRPDTKT